MANSTTINTCPLFPELEKDVMTAPTGVYTLPSATIIPQGVGVAVRQHLILYHMIIGNLLLIEIMN